MKIIKKDKIVLEGGNGTKSIILNKNQSGDATVSILYLQPVDDIQISVYGYVIDEAIAMKVTDVANYNIVSSITGQGLYSLSADSLWKVDLVYSSNSNDDVELIYKEIAE